jgi:mandelate racemase
VPFERMREFNCRFRLLGWQGLVGMAVSGLNMAFWDALRKAVGCRSFASLVASQSR